MPPIIGMSRELTPHSFIVITLVMLFISGCWTLASAIPFPINYELRVGMIATVAISNVSFLLSLLTSVLSYSGMGQERRMKRIIVTAFSIGVIALVISITFFSISYLISRPPYYYTD